MDTSISVFVFFAVIKVISSQGIHHGPEIDPSIPKQCYSYPADVNVLRCCPLRNMNNIQDLEACGIPPPIPTEPPVDRRSNEYCKKQLCLLRKKGLLNADDTLNIEKVETFLDVWSENQTHIKDGLEIGKRACLRGTKELPQPPFYIQWNKPCPADLVFECIPTHVLWNCKVDESYVKCRKLKAHVDDCSPYVYKNSQESSE